MPSVRDAILRHAKHYQSRLISIESIYEQSQENKTAALAQLTQELENIRRARFGVCGLKHKDAGAAQLCRDLPESAPSLFYLQFSSTERVQWLQDALNALEIAPDATIEASLSYTLGLALHEQGNVRATIPHYEKALEIFQAEGELENAAKVLNALGRAHNVLAETSLAIACHTRQLELAQTVNADIIVYRKRRPKSVPPRATAIVGLTHLAYPDAMHFAAGGKECCLWLTGQKFGGSTTPRNFQNAELPSCCMSIATP